jgi:N-glycosylase/DNA lyase
MFKAGKVQDAGRSRAGIFDAILYDLSRFRVSVLKSSDMKMRSKLKTPENFSFRHTVEGHGWCDLLPFELIDGRLKYVSGGIDLTVYQKGDDVYVEAVGDASRRKDMIATAKHILRLDHDLGEFYGLAAGHDAYRWITDDGAGRLLRSATVFEDLIKTLCTTNCSWSLTKKMIENLVGSLGERTDSGAKAFPTPKAMAKKDEAFYRGEIKAGYRSPFFVEIAEAVASGKVDPESWVHSELSTDELKKEIKQIKGIGDYAAEHMLKLLGRYDGLALDSWIRAEFYKKHNKEKPCADSRIHKHYKKYGRWRGLVLWCDMTQRWFEENAAK